MLMASRIAPWLQAFALALPALPGPAQAQQSPLARFIHQTRLDNGLDVIVVENPVVPLATILVAVRNGAFTQESAQEGLAHLYEHLLFRSYGGDPEAFAEEVGRMNGRYNGATDDEVVYYLVAVPSENVDKALKVMARLVAEARFSDRDLKKERPVVLDELQRGESDPEQRFQRQVLRALWGSSWSRKDVGGDSTSLTAITLDQLKEVYARYYVPNNAALIVTGDVTSERVFQVAREEFQRWKAAPDPFADRPIPPVAPRTATAAVMVGGDVLDVTIRIAMQGPSVRSDTAATFAADALFDVLDDPASAFQRRLVDNGPFQYVSAAYTTRDHTGLIEFVGKAPPERAREAVSALLGELDDLDLLAGVTEEDLAIAKKDRQVGTELAIEGTALLAPELAEWWSSAGMAYYLTYEGRMAAQTMATLRRFARDYVVSQPRVIGVLGPPLTIEQVRVWLRERTRGTTP